LPVGVDAVENDALIARLMKTFLGEAEEHIQTLNRNLLELEKQTSPAERSKTFKTLFRTAHSLKGAAHAVKVASLEAACHRLEELFAAASEGRRSIDTELFRMLFAVVDAIQDVVQRLRGQKDIDDLPMNALLQHLDAATAGEGTTPIPVTDMPAAAPEEMAAAPLPFDHLVRIPAEKLDSLLAHSGELAVAQRGAEARGEDAAALLEAVKRWRSDWRTVERTVERWLGDAPGAGAQSTMTELAEHRSTLSPRSAAAFRRTADNIHRFEQDLQRLAGGLVSDRRALERATGMLDAEIRRARLLPFAEACAGLERVVRDLAKAGGKEAELVIEGADIELDRSVLEGLKDPLLHLVRNSMDHGIEPPALRHARSKPARGQIRVAAALRGAFVEVTVADDGGGLDLAAIRERARQKNLPEPEDDRELARYVFLPNFSTAPIITEISGRGVGLDAVKTQVETMRGAVDLGFEEGRGTRFVLTLPLTLTTLRVLLTRTRGQTFAIDNAAIERLLRIGPDDLRSVDGRDVLALGGPPTPVVSLADLLDLAAEETVHAERRFPVVLLAVGGQRVGLLVDELLAEQEVMVRALGPRLAGLRAASGALVLPSGGVALILNTADLVRRATRHVPTRSTIPVASQVATKGRLIIADDSVTTRTLEKSILEAAGYDVSVASDGLEAWRLLQEKGADLVVSDVQMPRMDGFDLTAAIRSSQRFRRLPVVLVTGAESESDKARGLEVGANAYLLKSAFDQTTLLETIRQML
jgi:two-component system chemotaxis sensor kinase CheA